MGVLVVQSFNNGFETLLGPIFVLLHLITKVHNMPPIFSCVFCIRNFFYGMGKKNVKMSNGKISLSLFSCLSDKTYLWSHRRDLGWRRSPSWILTHLFTRIFVQQREKLELFAIQYMTCHEQGTFFFASLLMAEFVYELLDIAKYFVKKGQWLSQIFQYSLIKDCIVTKYY